jgi:hypothetical protein
VQGAYPGNQSHAALWLPDSFPGHYAPRMIEHDFDYQGWIERQADRRMAEDGRRRLDRPLEASFPDRAMIKTSVRSAWDDEGTPEIVWFSLFTRDGAEYRAERRVLVPEDLQS